MSIYFGKNKVKLNLNGISYHLNTYSAISFIKEIILSSSNNYLLKDFDGLYLSTKEEK